MFHVSRTIILCSSTLPFYYVVFCNFDFVWIVFIVLNLRSSKQCMTRDPTYNILYYCLYAWLKASPIPQPHWCGDFLTVQYMGNCPDFLKEQISVFEEVITKSGHFHTFLIWVFIISPKVPSEFGLSWLNTWHVGMSNPIFPCLGRTCCRYFFGCQQDVASSC